MERRRKEAAAEGGPEAGKKGEIQELTLEQAFLRLNEILAELDRGGQSLEDAFASYARGMEMVRLCNARIDKVEKQCLVISESGDDYEL
jgi:exodeoxyribonuclease VII small subunit